MNDPHNTNKAGTPNSNGAIKRRKADVRTDEKQARLAKALRENLRRRKAQLKGKRDMAAEDALKPKHD